MRLSDELLEMQRKHAEALRAHEDETEVETAVELEDIIDVPGLNVQINAKNVYLTIYPAGYNPMTGGGDDAE